jgi:hypothetical protein
MSAEQSVRDFLAKNAGRQFCDDCLSSALQIKPRQQVHQKTSKLSKERGFRRAPGICTRCHSDRIVIERSKAGAGLKAALPKAIPPKTIAPKIPKPQIGGELTSGEEQFVASIRAKDIALREFLSTRSFERSYNPSQWLDYLCGIKNALGNINNVVSFVATILIKEFLERRFAIRDFDAASKAQGASGLDIEAKSQDGKVIIGELKTTKPYQPGFGAAQRLSILKDLRRLASTAADHRFMFVIDADAFQALQGKTLASQAAGVEIVDLVTGKTFLCDS